MTNETETFSYPYGPWYVVHIGTLDESVKYYRYYLILKTKKISLSEIFNLIFDNRLSFSNRFANEEEIAKSEFKDILIL